MPGVSMPAGVTISYNLYTFSQLVGPPRIDVRPNYDDAGRVVVSRTYTISLEAVIHPDGDADTTDAMADLIDALTLPAGNLQILGTGFEDLNVNPAGGGEPRDVIWGPKPQMLSAQQLGHDQAWRISWRCEVCLAACPDESTTRRALAWNYTVAWSLDRSGLTTRIISGKVRIAQTRRAISSDTVHDSADRLREAVANIQLIPGYRRLPGPFSLSADRNTLEFTITDEQLPSVNAPPPGIIDCSASHSYDSALNNGGFVSWFGTIQASYEVARDQPRAVAWHYFRLLCLHRLSALLGTRTVIPLALTLAEPEIYGKRSAQFVLRYMTIVNGAVNNKGLPLDPAAMRRFVENSGLWRQPPDSGWQAWANSMVQSGVQSARGVSGLFFRAPGDDILLDICDSAVMLRANAAAREPEQRLIRTDFLPGGAPAPENSWLEYETRVRLIPRDNVVLVPLLPNADDPVVYDPPVVNADATVGAKPDYRPSRRGEDHLIQYRGRPIYLLEFTGKARRAGYLIDMPRLRTAGGKELHPMNDGKSHFTQGILGNCLVPICVASWRLLYVLTGVPTQAIAPPPNPLTGGLSERQGQEQRTLTGFFVREN